MKKSILRNIGIKIVLSNSPISALPYKDLFKIATIIIYNAIIKDIRMEYLAATIKTLCLSIIISSHAFLLQKEEKKKSKKNPKRLYVLNNPDKKNKIPFAKSPLVSTNM